MGKSLSQRLKLHAELVKMAKFVYHQPPSDIALQYPCIVYKRTDVIAFDANNRPYNQFLGYQVTVMDKDPDSDIPDAVSQLDYCRYQTFFIKDKIHHTVLNVYTTY